VDVEALSAELRDIASKLNEDELRVLVAIAKRLFRGRTAYRPLDVHGDPRNWSQEASEEAFDLSVYLACQTLRMASS